MLADILKTQNGGTGTRQRFMFGKRHKREPHPDDVNLLRVPLNDLRKFCEYGQEQYDREEEEEDDDDENEESEYASDTDSDGEDILNRNNNDWGLGRQNSHRGRRNKNRKQLNSTREKAGETKKKKKKERKNKRRNEVKKSAGKAKIVPPSVSASRRLDAADISHGRLGAPPIVNLVRLLPRSRGAIVRFYEESLDHKEEKEMKRAEAVATATAKARQARKRKFGSLSRLDKPSDILLTSFVFSSGFNMDVERNMMARRAERMNGIAAAHDNRGNGYTAGGKTTEIGTRDKLQVLGKTGDGKNIKLEDEVGVDAARQSPSNVASAATPLSSGKRVDISRTAFKAVRWTTHFEAEVAKVCRCASTCVHFHLLVRTPCSILVNHFASTPL